MTAIATISTLREAFDIFPGEVISLVGGGGKTTLMFALSHELITPERVVISTTTTKIFPPSSIDTPCLLILKEEKEVLDFILKNGPAFGHITLASEKLVASGKLQGIKPELVVELSKLEPVNYIIVEADGAARRSLKAPDPVFEPVIPEDTSLVIPVVGLDALGCKLVEENVFRSEIAAQLTGMALGDIVSSETIAVLLTHPMGIIHGSPEGARIIPFINKVDTDIGLSQAENLASKILEAKHPRIDKVVLGQALLNPPVVEVIFEPSLQTRLSQFYP